MVSGPPIFPTPRTPLLACYLNFNCKLLLHTFGVDLFYGREKRCLAPYFLASDRLFN